MPADNDSRSPLQSAGVAVHRNAGDGGDYAFAGTSRAQESWESEGGAMSISPPSADEQRATSPLTDTQIRFAKGHAPYPLTTTLPMTYRFTNGVERWKIAPLELDPPRRWQLHRAVNEVWSPLNIYFTPEAAMEAVGSGKTGVEAWDSAHHIVADFGKDKWSLERW